MITLITGAPGAGKSAALVDLLRKLAPDRAIYAHGIPDLKIDHQPLDEPSKWMESVPDGSIIVIDEVQTVWRPKGPGQGVPPDIQALETHRHRGLDFYIITQAPRLLHTNVRALIGRHVHLRDVGILGRYWYEWPECAENCTASYKTAPIRKKYKLPKAAFNLYKSASVHVKPVRSFPVMLVVLAAMGIGTLYGAFYFYTRIANPPKPDPVPTDTAQTTKTESRPDRPHLDQYPERPPTPEVRQGPPPPGPFDPAIFVPTHRKHPESAPAYDHLREVVNMPQVAGGICGAKGCRCYTPQGNPLDMSSNDCQDVLRKNAFNPYRLPAPPSGGPPPIAAAQPPIPEPNRQQPQAPRYLPPHPPGVLSMPPA